MKATETILGSLHGALADEFIKRIGSGQASPADLNAARQFLKDNGINCDGPSSPQMSSLMDKMPEMQEYEQ